MAFRRVPEAFAIAIPVGAAGLALVFLLHPSLYPWLDEASHLEGFRGLWLNPAFFFARAVVYVSLWAWFGVQIVRTSRAQDRSGAAALTKERTEELVDELAGRGKLSRDEARTIVDDVVGRWRSEALKVGERASATFAGLYRELGLVTRREYEELELRLAQLEHRLRLVEKD